MARTHLLLALLSLVVACENPRSQNTDKLSNSGAFLDFPQSFQVKPHGLSNATNLNPSLGRIAGDIACLNTPVPAGSYTVGEPFLFSKSAVECFSSKSNSCLSQNGSLSMVAGAPLQEHVFTINGVRLNEVAPKSMLSLTNDLNGAHLEWSGFDSQGHLDASLTLVQLDNGLAQNALLPCVAGILTVANKSLTKSSIEAHSSMCVRAPGTKPIWSENDTFVVFGDEETHSSFVLGLPGQHHGPQSDGLALSVLDGEVCLKFENAHELAARDEIGDLSSVLFTMCKVTDREDGFSRQELATQIGMGDFVNNPKIMRFIKADIRDSLVNYNQGNQANVFLLGKELNEIYNVYLNATGSPIAQVQTGPDGHFVGGIQFPQAKAGDFLRFETDGSYFDVTIEATCER